MQEAFDFPYAQTKEKTKNIKKPTKLETVLLKHKPEVIENNQQIIKYSLEEYMSVEEQLLSAKPVKKEAIKIQKTKENKTVTETKSKNTITKIIQDSLAKEVSFQSENQENLVMLFEEYLNSDEISSKIKIFNKTILNDFTNYLKTKNKEKSENVTAKTKVVKKIKIETSKELKQFNYKFNLNGFVFRTFDVEEGFQDNNVELSNPISKK